MSGKESGTFCLLNKPCSGTAKHTGPQSRPASKGRRDADQLYYPLDTKMEVETSPMGHSLALTFACSQVRGQRHTSPSMEHRMREDDIGTKSGTPGSRKWKVAGSAEGRGACDRHTLGLSGLGL